jgi:hypothetical protein
MCRFIEWSVYVEAFLSFVLLSSFSFTGHVKQHLVFEFIQDGQKE